MGIADSYNKSVLLLPLNGDNDGVVFSDYSAINHSCSPAGNAKTSTAQSAFYGSSAYFDGSGSKLLVPDHAAFNVGSENFAIVARVRPTAQTANYYHGVWGKRPYISTGGWMSLYVRNNVVAFGLDTTLGGSWESLTYGTLAVPTDQWSTLMLRKVGTAYDIYVNGVRDSSASITSAGNPSDTVGAPITIGTGNAQTDAYFVGYIQDVGLFVGIEEAFEYPAQFIGTISNSGSGVGEILDAAGDPAERIIQAVPRGAARAFLATSDVDGLYSLQAPMVEHNVLLLDDSTSYVDKLIATRVMPV